MCKVIFAGLQKVSMYILKSKLRWFNTTTRLSKINPNTPNAPFRFVCV